MRWLASSVLMCAACGGATTNDGGVDSNIPDTNVPDSVTTGCVNGGGQTYPVDASACVPQVDSTYSCNGMVCSYDVTIPCMAVGDAGGGIDCKAVCAELQPDGSPSTGFCQPFVDDAGTHLRCGGCGA